MNNDKLLELVKESGAVITINTDGKLWAITLTSIDQLRTLYELVRKEVVPEEEALRTVYESARRVLRFNGVDKAKTVEAVDELEDAIEVVKLFDGGNYTIKDYKAMLVASKKGE